MNETEGIVALNSAMRDKATRLVLQKLTSRGFNDGAPSHGGISYIYSGMQR
jgi:hypothetical protein